MLVDEEVYLAYKVDAFIEHHGVKGQKWGFRHPRLKALGNFIHDHKKLIIGAAAVGGILALKEGLHLKDSGELNQKLAKTFVEGVFGGRWKTDFKLANPGLNEEKLLADVVKPINKGFASNLAGTKNNCRRCTFAYELRRRGYNVEATRSAVGTGQDQIGLHNAIKPLDDLPTHKYSQKFQYAKEKRARSKNADANTPLVDALFKPPGQKNMFGGSPDTIFETLSREPERSRGELTMIWARTNSGHSMAYEVINGRAVVFDTQSGKIYKNAEAFSKLPAIKNSGFTRLDNLQLDEPFLQRWVKNAGS